MNKVPTLLLVAMISALGGAGVMWLISHGPGSTTRNIIRLGDDDRPATRVGVAVPFQSPSGPTAASTELDQEDAATIGPRPIPAPPVSATSEAVIAKDGESPAPSASAPAPLGVAVPSTPSFNNPPPVMAPNLAGGSASDQREQINDSLTVALEAAQPYAKEGFVIREDYWGGTLQQSAKAIQHQLFKGNEYWFWIGSDVPSARVSVHIYDSKGDLAESEDWQRKNTAAAHVVPARTGTYYIIVSDQAPDSQTPPRRPRVVPWAMAYGFR